ncbi:MAG: methyltransferase [Bryobacteraceae bacterium]|nr:methyltransferase [Bryobacteraceae bacterium]
MQDSRQLVEQAIARRPGPVPVDFGSTAVTGIHVSVVAALRDHFGLPKQPVKVHEPLQMLGWLEEDLKQAMGVDVEGVFRTKTAFGFANENWKPWDFNGLEVLVPGMFNTTVDASGDTLLYPEGDLAAAPSGRMPKGFHFFDAIIRQNHFDPENLNVEDNCEEFQPISEADLSLIDAETARAQATGRYVIASFGGTSFGDIARVPGTGMKDPRGIRDVAEWYVSLRSRRDYVHAVFERECTVGIANLARIHERAGSRVGAIFVCGTDFGTQTSAFCSKATFDELWLPYYRRVCDWVHANTSWKCFKHSCGSVDRFIPSFIEAGFDILNPVQCSATGMDPEHLKQTYGERITFWGGGVDTQHTLPFGTPAEVREQVLSRCETFARGGGFVFNSIHNIQAGTPVANVVAMLDAVREFNGRN